MASAASVKQGHSRRPAAAAATRKRDRDEGRGRSSKRGREYDTECCAHRTSRVADSLLTQAIVDFSQVFEDRFKNNYNSLCQNK
ncbi:unnamed protein product [Plutella xylostella]|uniref:(diamondback moth) hypothetical protein n=1 Tax=Plutella xylostella TaxID=51655 RepID=A0A8S4DFP6_PLUXY|nr:unnamed protein product [Plutella xylostella]